MQNSGSELQIWLNGDILSRHHGGPAPFNPVALSEKEAADGGVISGPLTLLTGPITASHLQSAAGFGPGSLREVSEAKKEVILVGSMPLYIFFFKFTSVR